MGFGLRGLGLCGSKPSSIKALVRLLRELQVEEGREGDKEYRERDRQNVGEINRQVLERKRECPFCYSCEKGRFNRPNRRVLIQIKIDPLIWDFLLLFIILFYRPISLCFSFLLLYEGSNLSLPLLLLLLLLF